MNATCQICDSELKEEQWYTDQNFDTKLSFYPCKWYRICSTECQEHAIQFNAIWNMKEKLRNMQEAPFSTFNAIFKFNEAGGYAEDKYRKMRSNPWLFLQTLDKNYFRNFALSLKTGVT